MLVSSFLNLLLLKLCLAAIIVAVSLLAPRVDRAQAQQQPFDLSVEIEVRRNSGVWSVQARNHGGEDAFGVTVQIELPDQIITGHGDEYDPATGVWHIGRLDAGSSKALGISTDLAPGLDIPPLPQGWTIGRPGLVVPARAVISSAAPIEHPVLLYNNTAEAWLSATVDGAYNYQDAAGPAPYLRVSVDNPSPQDGDTVNIAARIAKGAPPDTQSDYYGARVRFRFPPGWASRPAN